MNYICHLVVVDKVVLDEVGGLRQGCEGAQDHDMLLRLTETTRPELIAHIPRVLYHWRVTPGSVSQDLQRQEQLRTTITAVVDEHLRRRGDNALVHKHDDPVGRARLFANRVEWQLPAQAPKVSIIVPTRDRLDLLRPCVDSVLASAASYPGPLELIVVDNDSREPATRDYLDQLVQDDRVRVISHVGAFNYSAINNAAARQAQGEVLIFLNNDTQVLTPDWCRELVSQALRPDVGAVGARLLYQDGTLQHGGVLLGVEGVAGHEGICESPLDGGYHGRSQVSRSAAAVTAACLATRKRVFLGLDGGFDELDLQVAFNDVDYCMRVRRSGLRVVYTPFATLYHFESKSRGREIRPEQQARLQREARFFRQRWGDTSCLDPYYNPHFERYARPYARLRPPPA
jgi:GT2 family glycosyltransferase